MCSLLHCAIITLTILVGSVDVLVACLKDLAVLVDFLDNGRRDELEDILKRAYADIVTEDLQGSLLTIHVFRIPLNILVIAFHVFTIRIHNPVKHVAEFHQRVGVHQVRHILDKSLRRGLAHHCGFNGNSIGERRTEKVLDPPILLDAVAEESPLFNIAPLILIFGRFNATGHCDKQCSCEGCAHVRKVEKQCLTDRGSNLRVLKIQVLGCGHSRRACFFIISTQAGKWNAIPGSEFAEDIIECAHRQDAVQMA